LVQIDVEVSELGIQLREPVVQVQTTTQPQWARSNARIGFIKRLIERIAMRKIQQSSATISQQTSDKIKSEIKKLIEEKTQEGMSSVLSTFGPKVGIQLQRGQMLPESIDLSTTTGGLLASIRLGRVGEIGSLQLPDNKGFVPTAGFTVAVNTKSVSKMANAVRGGEVDSQVLTELLGQLSQGQQGNLEMLVPMTANFSTDALPIEVSTEPNKLCFEIKLSKVVSLEGQEYPDAECKLRVEFKTEKAEYQKVPWTDQAVLELDSLETECLNPEAETVANQFIHQAIQSGIPLPEIKGLKPRITQVDSGWLVIGWLRAQ
jgi:hypothetical protein